MIAAPPSENMKQFEGLVGPAFAAVNTINCLAGEPKEIPLS